MATFINFMLPFKAIAGILGILKKHVATFLNAFDLVWIQPSIKKES